MKVRIACVRSHAIPRVKEVRLIAGTRRHGKLGGDRNGSVDEEAEWHISGQETGPSLSDYLSSCRRILQNQIEIIRRAIGVSASASR